MSDRNGPMSDIERLAKKSGVSVTSLHPTDRDLLLGAFRQHFAGLPFPVSERPFNLYIADWLASLTGLIRTDVAEFRRMLVDFRHVARDTSGLAYEPAIASPGEAVAPEDFELTRALIDARAAERAAREARRQSRAAA